MKKMLLMTLVMLPALLLSATNSIFEDEDPEYVVIENESGTAERERSIDFVQCCLYRTAKIIELTYEGIGVPTMSLYDSDFNLVSCVYGTQSAGKLTIGLPVKYGEYYVVIESDIYLGEGIFRVY